MRLTKDLSYDALKMQHVIQRLPKLVKPTDFHSFHKIKSQREAFIAQEWSEYLSNNTRLGIGRHIDIRR